MLRSSDEGGSLNNIPTDAGLNAVPTHNRAAGYILDSLRWLVRLRWWAIAGVTVALLGVRLAGLVPSVTNALIVVAGLAAFNVLDARSRIARESLGRGRLESRAMLDIHVDLLALTLLLYFTGGVENPFAIFYVFHAAIGAIILRSPKPRVIAFSAVVMYGGMVMGEYFGIFPHHSLGASGTGEPTRLLTVLGRLGALAVSLLAVVYLVQTVARHRRRSEILQRSHARLAKSRERLARIGEISAGLAHSIRNPLHGALNCLQILRSDSGQTRKVEALELLDEGLLRMKAVTDRLLVLTRDAPVRIIDADLGEEVQRAVQFMHVRFRESDVGVRTELIDTGKVPLDPDRFHEALHNVLDNAFAASRGRAGEIDVILKGSDDDEPGGFCVIVRDRGTGIRPEDIDRVFDPFYTTKDIGEGSGLGLAIARKIMEAHGGTISVKSKPGVGTEVNLFLPQTFEMKAAGVQS